MNIARSLSELHHDPNSVVTVGTFDGVHRAHQEIIREVVARARKRNGRAVVVTFEPHPKEVVESVKGPVQLLTSIEERMDKLVALDVDLLFIIPFSHEFSRLSSRTFYEQYVVRGVGVSEVVVGYDHMFGRDREGGVQELMNIGREFSFSVIAIPPFSVDGEIVSSTRVRNALRAGNLARARELLGYAYELTGIIVRGDGRGKSLGFPTANMRALTDKKVIPARGVYLVKAGVRKGLYHGMLNIGVRPTVTDGREEVIEVHLFDFTGDLYGERITVSFLSKLRDEQRFATVVDLTQQLRKDEEVARRLISEQIKTN